MLKDIRFRICKRSGIWLFLAVDPVAGSMPIAIADRWDILAEIASKVAVNYAIARMERSESAR